MFMPNEIEDEILKLPQTIATLETDLNLELRKRDMFRAIANGEVGEEGMNNKYIESGLQESNLKVSDYENQIKDLKERFKALELQQRYLASKN